MIYFHLDIQNTIIPMETTSKMPIDDILCMLDARTFGCIYLKSNLVIIHDDEFLLKRKPINDTATKLYKKATGSPDAIICGNVIFAKLIYSDEGPDITGFQTFDDFADAYTANT